MSDFIVIDEINGQVTNSESNIASNLSSIKTNLNTINSRLNTVNSTAGRGAVKSVQRGIVSSTYGSGLKGEITATITISSINPSKSSVSLCTGMESLTSNAISSNRAQVGTGIYVNALNTTNLIVVRKPATYYESSYWGTNYACPAFS